MLLGCVVVIAATAATVATGTLLEVKTFTDALKQSPQLKLGSELASANAGGPQTILLIGSDKRAKSAVDASTPAHSNHICAGTLTGSPRCSTVLGWSSRCATTPGRRIRHPSLVVETCTGPTEHTDCGSGAPQIVAAVVWLKNWPGRMTRATAAMKSAESIGARTPWTGAARSVRRSRSGSMP